MVYEYLRMMHPEVQMTTVEQAWEYPSLVSSLIRLFEKWELSQYEKIIPPSEYQKRTLLRLGIPESKIEVIYNPVQLDLFDRVARRKIRGARKTRLRHIVAVGRLIPIKRFDLLIDAFRIVSSEMPGARLRIVGEGPERNNLEKQIDELGQGNQVELLGEVKHSLIPAILSESDLFVLCSDFESSPFSILEAHAASIPVVATQVGGIPEYVLNGKSGILVEPGQSSLLAEAMLSVLSDDTLSMRLAEEGRKFVQHLSFEDYYERMLNLYESMI